MRSAINTFLVLLFVLTVCLSSAVYAYDCPVGIESGHQTWNGSIYGSAPYLCLGTAGNCKYKATVNLCFAESGECVGDFVSTGDVCTESEGEQGNMMWPGGDFIDVPEPEEPEKMQTVCYNNYYSNETGALKVTCEYDMKMPALTSKVSQTNGIIERLYSSTNTHFSALSASLDQHDYFTKVFAESMNEKLSQQNTLLQESTDQIIDGVSSLETLIENGHVTGTETNQVLKSLNGMSNYYFPAIMNQIVSQASNVNTSVQATLGSLSRQVSSAQENVLNTMASEYSPTNKAIKENNLAINSLSDQLTALQNAFDNMDGGSGDNTEVMSAISSLSGDVSGLSDDIGTLSGTVDGLSTALGDGFEGLNTELQGIGDGIDSIVGTLNGDGLSTRGSEGKIDFKGTGLYGEDTLTEMKTEIEALQKEYSEQMKAMQGLFSFDSSELNRGEYVEHRWKFHIRGNEYSFGSGVFPALLGNSGLIAAVLVFLAVLFGIRFLVK